MPSEGAEECRKLQLPALILARQVQQIIEFSFPDNLKSFATFRKIHPNSDSQPQETSQNFGRCVHPESLELFMTESPDVSSPPPPGAAAASQPPSGPPAPLGSTLAWPAALLTPLPLAVPASSVFLCSPCKGRVISLSEKFSGV